MSFPKYPQYKDSGVEWLGSLPSGWRIAPIKAVASCNDEVLPESTDGDTLIEYVEISGVEEGRGITQTETMTFHAAPSRARRVVRHGDVLISTVRTYLRAIATVSHPPENLVASTGFAGIRPRDVHPGFLGYLLHCEYLMSEVIARSVGISYPAINASELMRLKGPIPSLQEQRSIADFLDRETAKIDALVEEQKRLIELLKEKRQAVISQAVTKGLDPNVPMKDSGVEWLGEVPAHWGVRKLKQVCSTTSGSTPNTAMQETYYTDETGTPWVRTMDLGNDVLHSVEVHITEQALNDTACKVLPVGTVMVAMYGGDGTVGKNGLLGIPAAINQAVCGLLPSDVLVPEYLFRYMQFYRPYWMIGAESSRKDPNISQERVRDAVVPLPPKAEQHTIAGFVGNTCVNLDRLCSEAERAVELLLERRAALISAAVTGKIDVRGLAPRPEAAAA
ncbi:MAG: restriction endonuclease subunit S [Proteobacteria bacterium]|jgi:type I restriction enzyme S subunit|nr:restriction endonuclease subunit S [Pseudomonadota bacterium]